MDFFPKGKEPYIPNTKDHKQSNPSLVEQAQPKPIIYHFLVMNIIQILKITIFLEDLNKKEKFR